jgi:hypothetical protein
MEEMMNSIFFVRILVKEMMSNVFLWDNPYSLQPTHLFISHKFHHLFFSYLVPQVTLSHFGPSFILFYTLAHLTLIIFLITWSQATSFYLNPSFLLFCTLVSCPFFLLILIFDFLFIYILTNNVNINLIRKVFKKYKMDTNIYKTFFFEFNFFKKISIREK